MKRKMPVKILFGLWFLLLLLACTLTTGQPPTIVPRPTATPLPTLGYATLSPEELPDQATPIPPSNAAILNLINQVSSQRLMGHVQQFQNFGTRHVNSAYNVANTGIGAARDYILTHFRNLEAQSQGRFRIIPHTFPVSWGDVESVGENVVGYLAGSETGAGVILLGAHYDSISFDVNDGQAYAPGANDNGSGVAALMEIAQVMAMSPEPPRASVIFAAFSAEEIGRVGSKAFITDYIEAYNLPLNAMMNMDIIGSSTGQDGSIDERTLRLYSPGPNEGSGSDSRQLARALNLIVHNYMPEFRFAMQDAVDREGRYSDHMSFTEAGYAAVRFIEPLEETARHHTERDTMDDIQPGYLTRATQALLVSTVALSDGPRPPRNVVVRDNGNGQRSLVWEPIADANSYIVALRYPGSIAYDTYFETSDTNISSEIFVSTRLAGVAIAGRDANGLMGPLSTEYRITN